MSTFEQVAVLLRKHGKSHAVGYGESYACACGAPLPTNSRKSIANHQAEQVALVVKAEFEWLHRKAAQGHTRKAWDDLERRAEAAEAHAETLRAALGALRGLASTTHSSFDDTYAMPGAKLRQIITDAETGTKGDK